LGVDERFNVDLCLFVAASDDGIQALSLFAASRKPSDQPLKNSLSAISCVVGTVTYIKPPS
jgi:hypothetical protein